MNKDQYSTFVFDCDGVVLDSNRIKTEGFRHVAQKYGYAAAEALVAFHVKNGGISRFRKFTYLLTDILNVNVDEATVQSLSAEYGSYVYEQLLLCDIAPGLQRLRDITSNSSWMMVSGGAQTELRQVFVKRGISQLFDLGIYGSPTDKEEILRMKTQSGEIKLPALFLGDSRYDHQASTNAGLDFLFIKGWTEFEGWQEYCHSNNLNVIKQLNELPNFLAASCHVNEQF